MFDSFCCLNGMQVLIIWMWLHFDVQSCIIWFVLIKVIRTNCISWINYLRIHQKIFSFIGTLDLAFRVYITWLATLATYFVIYIWILLLLHQAMITLRIFNTGLFRYSWLLISIFESLIEHICGFGILCVLKSVSKHFMGLWWLQILWRLHFHLVDNFILITLECFKFIFIYDFIVNNVAIILNVGMIHRLFIIFDHLTELSCRCRATTTFSRSPLSFSCLVVSWNYWSFVELLWLFD